MTISAEATPPMHIESEPDSFCQEVGNEPLSTNEPYIDYPFHFDGKGRTATADEDRHIYNLIRQVLFTNPGERVNRPDFGCGLAQLVFMPNSDALAAATQFRVQGALQHWLDDIIKVEQVVINNLEEKLEVTVVFAKRETGERKKLMFISEK